MDGNEETIAGRRVTGGLFVVLGYLVLVVAVLVTRRAVEPWGLVLGERERAALLEALLGHGAAFALFLLLFAWVRRRGVVPPVVSKIMLAAMPLLLLVSVDRLLTIVYPPPLVDRLYAPHPRRGWTFRPGGSDAVFGEEIRINAQGFRGPEVPYEKGAGEYRVLFLGDSVAVGFGVSAEDSFVRQFATLSPADAGHANVTSVNCSIRSYSPWQQVDLLADEGLRYDPDVVVHVFCLNDYVEKFQLTRFGGWSPGPHETTSRLLASSGVYRMIRAALARHQREDQQRRWELLERYSVAHLIAEPDAPRFQEAWSTTFKNMSEMVALARRHRIPLAIVCFPYARQLRPDAVEHPAPQARLAEFARAHDVPFFDLLPTLRTYAPEHELTVDELFLDSCHPTPLGHTLAAQEIRAFLIGHDMLPQQTVPDDD